MKVHNEFVCKLERYSEIQRLFPSLVQRRVLSLTLPARIKGSVVSVLSGKRGRLIPAWYKRRKLRFLSS